MTAYKNILSHSHNITVKIRKLTFIRYCYLTTRPYSSFTNHCNSIRRDKNPFWDTIILSLVSCLFNLLQSGSFLVFPWLAWLDTLEGSRNSTEMCSYCIPSGSMWFWFDLFLVMLLLITWRCLPGFSTIKYLLFFLFVINKNFVRRYFEIM